MHTIICTFDDKARAKEAVDALVRAGFARSDLHIEHKDAVAERASANDHWDSMEREVAVDPHVVTSFGHFFARLFGRDHLGGHGDRYARHVEHGRPRRGGGHARRRGGRNAPVAVLKSMAGWRPRRGAPSRQRPLRDILGAGARRARPARSSAAATCTRQRAPRATPSPIERERGR
jgi:hypothetical protein